jgi:hypothetical protein
MRFLVFLFTILLMLGSCQNPNRIQAQQSSEAAPNLPIVNEDNVQNLSHFQD